MVAAEQYAQVAAAAAPQPGVQASPAGAHQQHQPHQLQQQPRRAPNPALLFDVLSEDDDARRAEKLVRNSIDLAPSAGSAGASRSLGLGSPLAAPVAAGAHGGARRPSAADSICENGGDGGACEASGGIGGHRRSGSHANGLVVVASESDTGSVAGPAGPWPATAAAAAAAPPLPTANGAAVNGAAAQKDGANGHAAANGSTTAVITANGTANGNGNGAGVAPAEAAPPAPGGGGGAMSPEEVLQELLGPLYVSASWLECGDLLGEGGFAEVRRAALRDPSLPGFEEPVAVKALRPGALRSPRELREFLAEANLLRKMAHP